MYGNRINLLFCFLSSWLTKINVNMYASFIAIVCSQLRHVQGSWQFRYFYVNTTKVFFHKDLQWAKFTLYIQILKHVLWCDMSVPLYRLLLVVLFLKRTKYFNTIRMKIHVLLLSYTANIVWLCLYEYKTLLRYFFFI